MIRKTMKIMLGAMGLGLLISVSAVAQQKDFITVTGKVNFPPNAEHQEKFPFKVTGGIDGVPQIIKLKADSTYSFTVPSKPARLYNIDAYAWDRLSFWANDDDLKINFRGEDTAKVKIKNPPYVFIESEGRDNQLINTLNWEVYQNYQNVIAIGKRQYMATMSKDTAMHRSLTDMMMEQYDNLGVRAKLYAKAYRNEPQAIYALRYVNGRREQDFVLSIVDPLLEKYPWLTQAEDLKKDIVASIEAAKKTEIGAKFIDYTQLDPNGKEISVYGVLKGKKYLFVDFWASWCGPCRSENPEIVEVYEKYKDKGFEVLGVSLDSKKDAWLKAIKDDELTWPQMSDIKGWKNDFAQYYNITAIPANFLLDAEGKIVAKNLRGKSLAKEIEKLLGK